MPHSTFLSKLVAQLQFPGLLIFSLPKEASVSCMFDFKVGSTNDFALSLVEATNDPEVTIRRHLLGATHYHGRGLPQPKVEIKYATLRKNRRRCSIFACKMCFCPALPTLESILNYALNECRSTWHLRSMKARLGYILYNVSLQCTLPTGERVFSTIFGTEDQGVGRLCFERTAESSTPFGLVLGRVDSRMLSDQMDHMRERMAILFQSISSGEPVRGNDVIFDQDWSPRSVNCTAYK